jgi:formamidopyrimidine-DNA glycosylase
VPELPEVETVLRTVWPSVAGRTIVLAEVLHPDITAGRDVAEFARLLTGARFAAARRRGKYLVFSLETPPGSAGAGDAPQGDAPQGDALQGDARCLEVLVHLRMTGKLMCVEPACPDLPHTHLRLRLDDGTELRFADTRRFGRWIILDGAAGDGCAHAAGAAGAAGDPATGAPPPGYRLLGPEPLGPELDADVLAARLAKRRGKLKSALLDQHVVAGIGNIYADEILHRAGLHPERAANTLDHGEAARLHAATVAVLEAAIGKGGTTIRDYVNGRGGRGDFVYSLRVYGRTGEGCPTCGRGVVERIVVAGRSTHFCPLCQPAPSGGEDRHRGRAKPGESCA